RTHGGAVLASSARESSYAEKLEQALVEKTAIARAAAKRVRNGDVVALGPATTTALLAKERVTRSAHPVVTSSLLGAQAMVSARENAGIVVGGALRHTIRAFVGGGTVPQLLGLRADTAFLPGNVLAADFGLSTPAFPGADTDRAMATGAGRVIALVDHTKIGRRSSELTVPTDDIQHLITDSKSEKKQLDPLREAGVEVDAVRSLDHTFCPNSVRHAPA